MEHTTPLNQKFPNAEFLTVARPTVRVPSASTDGKPFFGLASTEIILTVVYLLAPQYYAVAVLLSLGLCLLFVRPAAAFALVFVQASLTAHPLTMRSVPLFSLAGFEFSVVDLLGLAGVLGAILLFVHRSHSIRVARSHLLLWIVILVAVLIFPVVRTWQRDPTAVQLAVKMFRPYPYLLISVLYFSILRRKLITTEQLLYAVLLAAIGSSVALLGHAYGWFVIRGFEQTRLSLSAINIERLQIVDEALLPVFIVIALISAVRGTALLRWTGVVATTVLGTALLISPGRGAIFSTVFVVGLVVLFSVIPSVRKEAAPDLLRPLARFAIVLVLLITAVNFGVSRLSDAETSEQQITLRTREALAPWKSRDFIRRSNGWRAGIAFGARSPLYGQGFVNPDTDLQARYGLDNPNNYPGAIPNLFAKGGLLVLVPLFGMSISLLRIALRRWRLRATFTDHVLMPSVLAVGVRAMSDDILAVYQVTIVVAVLLGVALASSASSRGPSSEGTLPGALPLRKI